MKRRILICIIMIFILLMVSCGNDQQDSVDVEKVAALMNLSDDDMKIGTLTVDNSVKLSDIEMTEYEITALSNYFDKDSGKDTSIMTVNKIFPIECLRCRKVSSEYGYTLRYYAVYKVETGGYYYVFWEFDNTYEQDKELGYDTEQSCYSGYIASLNSLEDFNILYEEVVIGDGKLTINELKDIKKIDAAAEYRTDSNGSPHIYCLLDDGRILKIDYYIGNYIFSDEEYCVFDSTEVKSRYRYDCCLGSIFSSDLPLIEE